MAYSRTWDATRPSGAIDASLIDDEMRILREDIAERLVDITGAANITGDPLIPADTINTALRSDIDALELIVDSVSTSRTYGMANAIRVAQAGYQDWSGQKYSIVSSDGSAHLIIPAVLPPGVTITSISATVLYQSSGHILEIDFTKRNGNPLSGVGAIPGITPETATVVQYSQTGMNLLVGEDDHMYFDIVMDNDDQDTGLELAVYQVKVTYTHPSAAVR